MKLSVEGVKPSKISLMLSFLAFPQNMVQEEYLPKEWGEDIKERDVVEGGGDGGDEVRAFGLKLIPIGDEE